MLLENFYQTTNIEKAESETVFSIELNREHNIYQGHFPQEPILPGVCTIQIIKECAQQMLGKELQYVQVPSCKFLMSINPIENNRIKLSVSVTPKEDDTVSLVADGVCGEQAFLKLKAVLRVNE